jgi:hypothetical protein
MAFETGTEIVKVRLPDGTELNFETTRPGGERKVVKLEDVLDSSKIAKTIEGTVEILRGTFERIKPEKAPVKFGLETAQPAARSSLAPPIALHASGGRSELPQNA